MLTPLEIWMFDIAIGYEKLRQPGKELTVPISKVSFLCKLNNFYILCIITNIAVQKHQNPYFMILHAPHRSRQQRKLINIVNSTKWSSLMLVAANYNVSRRIVDHYYISYICLRFYNLNIIEHVWLGTKGKLLTSLKLSCGHSKTSSIVPDKWLSMLWKYSVKK